MKKNLNKRLKKNIMSATEEELMSFLDKEVLHYYSLAFISEPEMKDYRRFILISGDKNKFTVSQPIHKDATLVAEKKGNAIRIAEIPCYQEIEGDFDNLCEMDIIELEAEVLEELFDIIADEYGIKEIYNFDALNMFDVWEAQKIQKLLKEKGTHLDIIMEKHFPELYQKLSKVTRYEYGDIHWSDYNGFNHTMCQGMGVLRKLRENIK